MSFTLNKQSNTLGNANLVLSIPVLLLVFRIGLGTLVGVAGLFGKGRSCAAAIAGLSLGLGGVSMFLDVLTPLVRGAEPFKVSFSY